MMDKRTPILKPNELGSDGPFTSQFIKPRTIDGLPVEANLDILHTTSDPAKHQSGSVQHDMMMHDQKVVCFYLEVYKYLEIAYLHPNIESCLIMQ
jgi:hypothetical protein